MIVCIGEGMIELRLDAAGGMTAAYGGDTLNTAVYLARGGAAVAYLTALGRDAFSERLLAGWRAEGIDTALVLRHPERLPGIYGISTDAAGERSFHYWRDRSAARALFAADGVDRAFERAAATADLLYLSGITLSLYDDTGRGRLIDLARRVRARGGRVAFDPNYRPAGWPSRATARQAVGEIAPLVDIALPTLDDEQALFGSTDAQDSIDQWRRRGAAEVVVKLGAAGCRVAADGRVTDVPAPVVRRVVDTTGAGDAFNGGFLAARLSGATATQAARRGNRIAARVVTYPGAIAPRPRRRS